MGKKKSMSLPLNYVILAIILLVTLFVILFITTNMLGKEKNQITDKIDALGDADNDDIGNMFDKCPCTSGSPSNEGCPEGTPIPEKKDKSCYTKK